MLVSLVNVLFDGQIPTVNDLTVYIYFGILTASSMSFALLINNSCLDKKLRDPSFDVSVHSNKNSRWPTSCIFQPKYFKTEN